MRTFGLHEVEEKTMKRYIALILILISSFLVPELSHGELREGSIEISPFIGYCTGATSPRPMP